MNPMKYRVSSECSKLIRKILQIDPEKRPSIKEILESQYVLQMSQKFNWDLKKLLKFRKMKENNLQASMISGMSYMTNTSQSDSFFFENQISGFNSILEAKNSKEKNQIISSLNQKSVIQNGSKSGQKVVPKEGQLLNFEKKNGGKEVNIFLKEIPKSGSKSEKGGNVFSQKESGEMESEVISQNISGNISQIRGDFWFFFLIFYKEFIYVEE
jgi:serine/threonine protein kinase